MNKPSEVFSDVWQSIKWILLELYGWLPVMMVVPLGFYPESTAAFLMFMSGVLLAMFKVVVWVELYKFREEEARRVEELMFKVRGRE